ncbi:YicC/YloC family endoribonuclease [Emcibacter sp. SYSU 3D8]|uniref:YicC/YloC family endoribonuclease n=1 Tax=Emcibacter sp. SYSU 3D8 TaxID=3133969 RepID=UPI0031FE99F4
MAIASMTGFARLDGAWQEYRWVWEVKSVNGKGLDVRMRMPQGMESLDIPARALIAESLSRGSVNCLLQFDRVNANAGVSVNNQVLDSLVEAAKAAAERHGLKKPRIEELLELRGVIEVKDTSLTDEQVAERDKILLAGLAEAVRGVVAMRRSEGARMAAVLHDEVRAIGELVNLARAIPSQQPGAMRERLQKQISDLLEGSSVPIDQDRLAQEAAYLAVKADVREELDRLSAHVVAATELLDRGGPAGRKLDFLAQEFSREANTVCSKSSDPALSRIGLDLKSVIDQLREQVANIE